MYELLNKQTTSTWVEERQAYHILRESALKIIELLSFQKFKKLSRSLAGAIERAHGIYNAVTAEGGKREPCSYVAAIA